MSFDFNKTFLSIQKKKAERGTYISEKNRMKKLKEEYTKNFDDLGEARNLLQKAAQETQKLLEHDISTIVTLALDAIPFDNPYKFTAKFETRRNTTECDLLFVAENGETLHPLESCGYGAADIASFALRIAYWSMQEDARNCIIADEPFSNLDKLKHPYASQLLRELSERLELQFILSTHEPSIIECADRIFNVSKKGGVTHVVTK